MLSTLHVFAQEADGRGEKGRIGHSFLKIAGSWRSRRTKTGIRVVQASWQTSCGGMYAVESERILIETSSRPTQQIELMFATIQLGFSGKFPREGRVGRRCDGRKGGRGKGKETVKFDDDGRKCEMQKRWETNAETRGIPLNTKFQTSALGFY